jgi:hypothetical protein
MASTLAGLAGSPGIADGTNSAARFNASASLTLDSAGNIYVTDSGNYTIRKLSPAGSNWVASTIAGTATLQGSTDGTNHAALFGGYYGGPKGIAMGAGTNLFVVDYANNTVRKVAPAGGTNWVTTTIAGIPPYYTSGTNNGAGGLARFYGPAGLAFDRATNLYLADGFNNTIRKLKRVGSDWIVSTIAGQPGVVGSADGTNSGAQFNTPYGIAVDGATNIYVADDLNGSVRKLRPVGTNWVSSTLAGGVSDTNIAAQFGALAAIAVDSHTNLYVTDYYKYTVSKIRQVGTNWVTSTIAGTAGVSGSADGTNKAALFGQPGGLVVDALTNIYVVDSSNSTIRKITAFGTNWVTTTIAGQAGVLGNADGTNTDATFSNPSDITRDSQGNLFVSGVSGIRRLTPVGTDWVTSTISDSYSPQAPVSDGIAVDGAGNIFVTDFYANIVSEGVPMAVTRSPPVILSFVLVNGLAYEAQYASDLSTPTWTLLASPFPASGPTMSACDPIGPNRQRFYRVVLLP